MTHACDPGWAQRGVHKGHCASSQIVPSVSAGAVTGSTCARAHKQLLVSSAVGATVAPRTACVAT